jgi:hypothetical protein
MTTFVLDYDHTFTVNPDMWVELASIIKKHGFTLIGATARNRYEPITDQRYFDICDSVVYCAGNAKQKVLQNFHYPEKLVWIDDDPVYIVYSYSDVHDQMYCLDDTVAADYYTPHIA